VENVVAGVDELAFFQCLARVGSLTEAARELGLSLSAVSKRLKQLEARLGVQLAARTTRHLSLTPEGERYVARGSAILDELAELEDSLRDPQTALAGRLCVNATFGFGRRHVAPLLSEFATRHPGVSVQLDLTFWRSNLNVRQQTGHLSVCLTYCNFRPSRDIRPSNLSGRLRLIAAAQISGPTELSRPEAA